MTSPDEIRAPRPITLADVAATTGGTLRGDAGVVTTGIRHDSRAIARGDLFVARAGDRVDGVTFVGQAIVRGAAAIMVARDRAPRDLPIPVLIVPDVDEGLAHAASLIYGHPTRELSVVGITGTNGKTTTAYLVRSVLERLGKRPGIMGTLGNRLGQTAVSSLHNTPEADEVTRIAAWMLGKGASHLLMEATSHGIARKRLDGVRFEVAALTNLTHDHLDLHGSMEAYGQAKARLFTELSPANAAVVVDGDFGAQLARQVPTEVLRVSCQPQGRADIRPAAPAVLDAHGIRCSVLTPTGTVTLSSPLVGRHNLENLLLAQAVLIALGVDGRQAARQLGQCTAVSGRLERCDGPGDDLIALVDYAHTPDGLDKALAAARLLTDGRVLCVFGCGGNRDPAKRPLMGHVAGRLADETIVTNDNPRTEPPESIAAAIIDELHRAGADFAVELDRAAAIELAVSHADPGDAVVVAGKGHETTQIVGTESVPFDDSSILRRALKRRRNLPPGA